MSDEMTNVAHSFGDARGLKPPQQTTLSPNMPEQTEIEDDFAMTAGGVMFLVAVVVAILLCAASVME